MQAMSHRREARDHLRAAALDSKPALAIGLGKSLRPA